MFPDKLHVDYAKTAFSGWVNLCEQTARAIWVILMSKICTDAKLRHELDCWLHAMTQHCWLWHVCSTCSEWLLQIECYQALTCMSVLCSWCFQMQWTRHPSQLLAILSDSTCTCGLKKQQILTEHKPSGSTAWRDSLGKACMHVWKLSLICYNLLIEFVTKIIKAYSRVGWLVSLLILYM